MVNVSNFCSWDISDFDFPISGHLFLYKPRYCWVPQNKWSALPFFIVLLYRVVICAIDIFCSSRFDFLSCVNLFIIVFYCLLYFIYRAVLSFSTAGDSCLEDFSIKILESTPYGLLEKPWKITNGCIKFWDYWRGISSFIKFGFSWMVWCWWKIYFSVLFQVSHHCVKSVHIRSHSGPHFPAFGF